MSEHDSKTLPQRLRSLVATFDGVPYDGAIELEAAAEIERLRNSLTRCLKEAEDWLNEARGCKPSGVIDYGGWADEARALLSGVDTIPMAQRSVGSQAIGGVVTMLNAVDVGQVPRPGCFPEVTGPSPEEARRIIESLEGKWCRP